MTSINRHLRKYQPGAKLTITDGEEARAFNIDPSERVLQVAADAYEQVVPYSRKTAD